MQTKQNKLAEISQEIADSSFKSQSNVSKLAEVEADLRAVLGDAERAGQGAEQEAELWTEMDRRLTELRRVAGETNIKLELCLGTSSTLMVF